MSFAIFDYDGMCIGEGKTKDEAVDKACETLAAAGSSEGWFKVRLVEYIGSDQDSYWIDIHRDWNGMHPLGQS